MIYSITGTVADIMPGAVAIENNGVAFLVNVPDNSYAFIAPKGEVLTLYTAMTVREDDISLYGFTDKDSLSLFKLLQTVQGVGAKAALSILSIGGPAEIKRAIVFEDTDAIQKANGVGKKTAQRVVLELKDKVEALTITGETITLPAGDSEEDKLKNEALAALMALGYTKTEAASALIGIKAKSVEEYISKALKNR